MITIKYSTLRQLNQVLLVVFVAVMLGVFWLASSLKTDSKNLLSAIEELSSVNEFLASKKVLFTLVKKRQVADQFDRIEKAMTSKKVEPSLTDKEYEKLKVENLKKLEAIHLKRLSKQLIFKDSFTWLSHSLETKAITRIIEPSGTIISPQDGEKVGFNHIVSGEATLAEGESLWVLVAIDQIADLGQWYPQGNPHILNKGEWEQYIYFGDASDRGHFFSISAIAVKKSDHSRLQNYFNTAIKSGSFRPIHLESYLDDFRFIDIVEVMRY